MNTVTEYESRKPLLQIVHVSDLHLLKDYSESDDARIIRRILRRADLIGPPIAKALGRDENVFRDMVEAIWTVNESGRYGHDEKSIELLERWLSEMVLDDDDWRGVPIWLIDTGDQTTNGDQSSLEYSYDVLDRLSAALGGAPVARIHGNHDAWPGRPPYTSSSKRLNKHREWLRARHYPASYPNDECLTLEVAEMDIGIDVFSLNSIVHDWVGSVLAQGEIAEDMYWRKGKKWPLSGEQVRSLQRFSERRLQADKGRRLRIVLSHHPVAMDKPFRLAHRHSRFIGLDRASAVASTLAQRHSSLGGSPIAHLVLGGHTHRLHPSIGSLEGHAFGRTSVAAESPLQLVIGTGMKRPAFSRSLNGQSSQRSKTLEIQRTIPATGSSFENFF